MTPNRKNLTLTGLAAVLAALTLAAYWPLLGYDFIGYDDNDYVTSNTRVQAGLNWENLVWAFRSFDAANWHPLTWLSHMLDVQLFGLWAGGHHLTNLLFHLANAWLLFMLLNRLTRALWRSALVAALFALHPLHVESVAWVAERKDVLSGFFFFLTLWAYMRYVTGVERRATGEGQFKVQSPKSKVQRQQSGVGSASPRPTVPNPQAAASAARLADDSAVRSPHSAIWYALALFFFALGLLAKPMLVTLPFVLLLLDFWPLSRFKLDREDLKLKTLLALLGEKLPFFALSAASSFVTLFAQGRGGAVIAFQDYGLPQRLANAATAYLKYLDKTFWPSDLAIFYPHRFQDPAAAWPAWQSAAAGFVLLGISILACLQISRKSVRTGTEAGNVGDYNSHGWFPVGWFWYLGMLVPAIGLVQVGSQAMADRYTYLPLIGVFLCATWGGTALLKLSRAPSPNPVGGAVAIPVVLLCAGLTRHQVGYWHDDFRLFEHALALSDRNAPAHTAVGLVLAREHKYGFALEHCRAAVSVDPSYTAAWQVMGDIYNLLGRQSEAVQCYLTGLRWKQASPWTWFKLGCAREALGQADDAEKAYRTALQFKPDLAGAHSNLGTLLLARGDHARALEEFACAARLSPKSAIYHYNLGTTLVDAGKLAEGESQLSEAIRLNPDYLEARAAVAGVLFQEGKTTQAQAVLQELEQRCPATAEARFQAGHALLIAGLTNDAVRLFGEARALAPQLPFEFLEAGKTLVAQNKLDEASARFQAAVLLEPENPEIHQRLGLLLAHRGKLDEAFLHLNTAVQQRERLLQVAQSQPAPDGASIRVLVRSEAESRYHLGLVLAHQGKLPEAISQYRQVLETAPDFSAALNDLAWILATAPQASVRDGPEAVRLAERACRLTGTNDFQSTATLAAAYAESGRFEEAVKTAEQALALASRDQNQAAIATTRLELYRQKQS